MGRMAAQGFVALVLLLLSGSLAYVGVTVGRVYRHEMSFFHPAQGSVARPEALDRLGGFADVAFASSDGTSLRGWYRPGTTGAAVVLTHGSGANRAQVASRALLLARHGFGVLLFDWPGHGESGGRVALGAPERDALRAGVGWLAAQEGVTSIGAFGFSLGAWVVAQAAPDDPRLGAVALEGCPTDLVEQTEAEYTNPVARWAALLALRRAGADVSGPQPIGALPRFAPRPILLLAGSEDRVVPLAMATRLRQAAPWADLVVLSGTGHDGARGSAATEYEVRLVAFFEGALGRTPPPSP